MKNYVKICKNLVTGGSGRIETHSSKRIATSMKSNLFYSLGKVLGVTQSKYKDDIYFFKVT